LNDENERCRALNQNPEIRRIGIKGQPRVESWTFRSRFVKLRSDALAPTKKYNLTVSEVGFGLWTISTGWWGNFTEGEAIALSAQGVRSRHNTFRCG
jgi:hypothetical protein